MGTPMTTRSTHALATALLLAAMATGCDGYDAPPEASLVDMADGLLPDSNLPLVVQFSEPVNRDTARLRVAAFVTDAEGNLGDEDSDPATELSPAYQHDPDVADRGGTSTWLDDSRLRIVLDVTPPVGQSNVFIAEPELADSDGNTTDVRQRIVFGYEFSCAGKGGSKTFEAGTYFFLVDVEDPLETQIQLFASIAVDGPSGRFLGAFANADRNRDPDRCPTPCKSTEACQLLPEPKCVVPSERAGTVDEYPDFVPNFEPPSGFSFLVAGCVVDQEDGSVAFANSPTDVVVQAPPVTVKGIILASGFAPDAAGVLRGTGTMKSADVLLGTSSSGPGKGSLTARRIPDADAPPGLPQPPPLEPLAEEPDAGQ
jgi:hypothetical protein